MRPGPASPGSSGTGSPVPGDPGYATCLADLSAAAPHAAPGLLSQEADYLLTAWSEPHRAYHTGAHLAELFAALDELAAAGALPEPARLPARLAGWYHDVAYDPRARRGSNEHRSAAIARDHLHRLGADPDLVDTVEELVVMTVDHDPGEDAPAPPGPPGAGVSDPRQAAQDAFHDADLWILGAPGDRYAAYRAQVAAEYAHLPPAFFAAGRAVLLQELAARPRLYRTRHAHRCWGERARRNLGREIAELTGPRDGSASG